MFISSDLREIRDDHTTEKTLPKVYVAEKWACKIKSITYPVLCEASHVTFLEYGNSVFRPVPFNEGSFELFVIIRYHPHAKFFSYYYTQEVLCSQNTLLKSQKCIML